MFIYVGKTFTSTATGSVIKDVVCEKCRKQFFYELARSGTGSGSAPYYIGQNSAQERAQRAAQSDLEYKLRTECELVPCPHCGHIQQEMTRVLARQSYRGLVLLSWLLPGAGLLITGIAALSYWSAHPMRFQEEYGPYIWWAAGFAALIPLFLGIRKKLIARGRWIEPLLAVAPTALLPASEPGFDGRVPLAPVPRASRPDSSAAEWVTLPVLRMALPPICCECLAPATTVYKSPFKVSDNAEWEMPICADCARRLRREWWKSLTITLLATVTIALFIPVLPFFPRGVDDIGKWIMAGVFGLFGTVFAAAIVPNLLTKPHHVRGVDEKRGIVRMRFRNPQYTQLLRQMADELDGVTPNDAGSASANAVKSAR